MGYDPTTKWVALFMYATQSLVAYWVADKSWWVLLTVAYVFGAVMNHSMLLCIHECSHALLFKSRKANKLFGIFLNGPMLLPASVPFARYHKEHHKYQGTEGVDVDLPTALEARIFQGVIGKLIWVSLQGFFYTFRPMFVRPKSFTRDDALNWVSVLTYGYVMYTLAGPGALIYLAASDILGMGLNPAAGHFIAEHYAFVNGYETYTSLSPMRWIIFNVNFHTAHHDFPSIPGSRLPLVREIAWEFYKDLPVHNSYTHVIWEFITNPEMSLWKRVKRTPHEE